MVAPHEARVRPCPSCPYRLDCPSGMWAASEYKKLPKYDGDMGQQAEAGAAGLFMCHNTPDRLCAGWLGTHGVFELLAIRLGLAIGVIAESVLDFKTRVRLHPSGQAAYEHGIRDIEMPSPAAIAASKKVLKVRSDVQLG